MADIIDPVSRVEALIATQESAFARGFRLMVANIRNEMDLTEIADLLERGRLEDALTVALRRVPNLGTLYMNSFVAAAQDTASFLNKSLEQLVIDFDQTNPFAVEVARENRLRLVREFTQKQREATRSALLEGVQTGANPRAQARAFRDSIGLTEKQLQTVARYRSGLEAGERRVLDLALRDKRFDPTIQRAIESGKPLTRTQINRMVDRYRERFIAHRSRVIARTEALRSVHQGKQAMYLQAFENGDLDPGLVENEWQTSLRENVRDSHVDMHGQKRPFGENFVSGAGNQAPHPGAFFVAAEDIQCVCTLSTRITQVAVPEGLSVEILG